MIDIHNHILPNVDDGSTSLEMSLNMLKEAASQGITDVVNTVHFQHPKMMSINTSYELIKIKRDKLQEKLKQKGIDIKIHLGAEVYFNNNLVEIVQNPITKIGNKYMLVEFNTLSFPVNFETELFKLAVSGIIPIIAHPERYRPIQENVKIAVKLVNSGYLLQMDAGSLLGHFGERCKNISEKMLDMNLIHFLGSDAHNDRKRNFCLLQAKQIAKSAIGNKVDYLVDINPRKAIKGEYIEAFDTETVDKQTLFNKIRNFIKSKNIQT